MEKEIDSYLTPHTKINWGWIKELNIKRNNYKYSEENRNLHYLGLSKDFLHMIQIVQATTKKVNGHYQESKKTNQKMRENIWQLYTYNK